MEPKTKQTDVTPRGKERRLPQPVTLRVGFATSCRLFLNPTEQGDVGQRTHPVCLDPQRAVGPREQRGDRETPRPHASKTRALREETGYPELCGTTAPGTPPCRGPTKSQDGAGSPAPAETRLGSLGHMKFQGKTQKRVTFLRLLRLPAEATTCHTAGAGVGGGGQELRKGAWQGCGCSLLPPNTNERKRFFH